MAQVWQAMDRIAEGIITDTQLQQVGIAPGCIEPGGTAAGHSHTLVEEINIFKSGSGQMQIENETFDVCEGSVAVVKAGQFHETFNTGDENLEYIVVFNTNVDTADIDFKDRHQHFGMDDTPTYYTLLSKIAAGECRGATAFNAWAKKTPNPDFAKVLKTIAIREAEHSSAFEKRLCELGHEVDFSDVDPKTVKDLEFLASDAGDLDKIKCLGFDNLPEKDGFSSMLRDQSIDPTTGALLGRYIAEERDSARMVNACCQQMFGDNAPAATNTQSNVTLDQVCEAVTSLTGLVRDLQSEIQTMKAPAKAAPKKRAKAKAK
jgi:mannose-6-phosphate isomerase-like protein (cupin superfamily)/rubrerythrin